MEARLDVLNNKVLAKAVKYVVSADKVIVDSTLPNTIRELVKIRASQINGCAYCLDMHTKDAAAAGEDVQRLHLVAAWREAKVFTDDERAAMDLTEHATRIADGGHVSDEVWETAAKYFDDEQLGAIAAQIAIINAFNRMNVIVAQPAGDYQVGQFG